MHEIESVARAFDGLSEELKLVLVSGSGFTVRRRGTTFRGAPGQLIALHADDAHSGVPEDLDELCMALLARDRRGPRILLQVLVYPVTNYDFGPRSYTENATGYVLTTEDMRWFWRHYLSREEQGQEVTASPFRAKSLADLPPALVMTAGCDPLRDEGDAYAARLRDAGVPVTLTQYPGMFHGFLRMTRILDQARGALDEVATALRKALA